MDSESHTICVGTFKGAYTKAFFQATFKLYLHHTNEILLTELLTERSGKQPSQTLLSIHIQSHW